MDLNFNLYCLYFSFSPLLFVFSFLFLFSFENKTKQQNIKYKIRNNYLYCQPPSTPTHTHNKLIVYYIIIIPVFPFVRFNNILCLFVYICFLLCPFVLFDFTLLSKTNKETETKRGIPYKITTDNREL